MGIYNKKTRIFGLLGFLTVASSSAFALDPEECLRRLPPSVLTVSVEPLQISTDYTQSVSALRVLHKTEASKAASGTTVGLTTATPSWKMEVKIRGLASTNKAGVRTGFCARPRVEVVLSYAPVTVYVANSFVNHTCAFNHIYQHELKHVKIYEEALVQTAAWLQAELTAAYENYLYYGKEEDFSEKMRQDVHTHWTPLIKQRMLAVEEKHKMLDSPEEYRTNQTACAGEIPRILKGLM